MSFLETFALLANVSLLFLHFFFNNTIHCYIFNESSVAACENTLYAMHEVVLILKCRTLMLPMYLRVYGLPQLFSIWYKRQAWHSRDIVYTIGDKGLPYKPST